MSLSRRSLLCYCVSRAVSIVFSWLLAVPGAGAHFFRTFVTVGSFIRRATRGRAHLLCPYRTYYLHTRYLWPLSVRPLNHSLARGHPPFQGPKHRRAQSLSLYVYYNSCTSHSPTSFLSLPGARSSQGHLMVHHSGAISRSCRSTLAATGTLVPTSFCFRERLYCGLQGFPQLITQGSRKKGMHRGDCYDGNESSLQGTPQRHLGRFPVYFKPHTPPPTPPILIFLGRDNGGQPGQSHWRPPPRVLDRSPSIGARACHMAPAMGYIPTSSPNAQASSPAMGPSNTPSRFLTAGPQARSPAPLNCVGCYASFPTMHTVCAQLNSPATTCTFASDNCVVVDAACHLLAPCTYC
jgi:hypothetical protein